MAVFTYNDVGVVACEYVQQYNPRTMTHHNSWRVYDIHGNSTQVSEQVASRFRGFLLIHRLTALEYKHKCVYEWAKTQKQQPRWKRVLAWCITNISRTIG